jgi:hypothetical protein
MLLLLLKHVGMIIHRVILHLLHYNVLSIYLLLHHRWQLAARCNILLQLLPPPRPRRAFLPHRVCCRSLPNSPHCDYEFLLFTDSRRKGRKDSQHHPRNKKTKRNEEEIPIIIVVVVIVIITHETKPTSASSTTTHNYQNKKNSRLLLKPQKLNFRTDGENNEDNFCRTTNE